MTDDRLLAAKKKFSRLLKEIFQFDCADLDFGIYRILAMRRTELEKFLDEELLPQVEGILASAVGDRENVTRELTELEQRLRNDGLTSPQIEEYPKRKELVAKLAASPDVAPLAREVFSDLTTFFARYYDEGDFMALPRYKGDTYAIPYDGSEVKLHWANADQYYIKTTVQHADYAAVLDGVSGLDKPRLRFRLAAAESDRDNNKSSEKRRYVLRGADPVETSDNELTVWFEYRVPEPGSGRQPTQKALCEEAEKAILAAVSLEWQLALARKASQNPDRYTVLGYQLYRYTKKNTSDYFIHKNLGGFLRRELDFFIKNEVIFLDDLEGRSSSDIDVALQKVKAIRAVGGKIIDWLAQIENFQKRLYLKRKFVLLTEWYASSDQLDIGVGDAVVKACRAHPEWKEHFEQAGPLELIPAGTLIGSRWAGVPSSRFAAFLSATGGASPQMLFAHLAVKADNYQALRLLGATLNRTAGLVYIDPPYNTGNDGFLYRDGYRRSSWAAMMFERLILGRRLLRDDGLFLCSISDIEIATVRRLQDVIWGEENHLSTIVWNNEGNIDNQSRIKENHEYVTAYAAINDQWPGPLVVDPNIPPDSKLFNDTIENSITKNGPANPPSSVELPIGFPCAFETGPVEVDTKAWPRLSNRVSVQDSRTMDAVTATSGWSSRALLDEFLGNGMDAIRDIKGRKTWFSLTQTGAIYCYKERGDEKSHVLSVVRNLGTTKQTSGALARMGLSFDYPKPVGLISYLCSWCNDRTATIIDFFAGSGTTAHAVLNLNRRDGGNRRFVVVEGGEHFRSVTLPRILKSAIADEWQDGKPKSPAPPDRPIKVLYLESYDDALENIELTRLPDGSLFDGSAALREDYTLHYLLNLESEGSLLNLEHFRKPWDYTIKVRRDGVVQDSPVDLVETFNYLIGLRVKRYDTYGQEGLLFVLGTDPEGRRVIVVWRDCDLWPNDKLEEKCRQAFESFRPSEFDLVYVNGDNHLPIIKTGEESWKVNLIEETFHARMFDTSDVE